MNPTTCTHLITSSAVCDRLSQPFRRPLVAWVRPFCALAVANFLLIALALPAVAVPEISVEQPTGTPIADGGTKSFGDVVVNTSNTLTFTIKNSGNTALTLSGNPRVVITGAHAADFVVTEQPAASVVGGTVTVANAGFEVPVQAANSHTYAPVGSSWTFGNSAGIGRNGSFYSSPAPEGVQSAFLESGLAGTTFSQAINFPAAGDYEISFSAIKRQGNAGNDVNVTIDGAVIGTLASGSQDDTWRRFAFIYRCTAAGSHTLAFTGLRSPQLFNSSIDKVQISPATTFQVTFAPRPEGGGTRTATLSIVNNDGDENPYDITLTGTTPLMPAIALEQPAGTALATGAVVTWGDNQYGQRNVPAGLPAVKAIAAGGTHTTALLGDGTVRQWGLFGQGSVPAGLGGVIAVAAGDRHTLALKSDGTVVAWGNNEFNQTTVPAGLANVVAIGASANGSAAVKSDGTVVTWGYSLGGQPAGLNNAVSVAKGVSHTVALKNDGTVVAWGQNFNGEADVPPGLTGVIAISAGLYDNLALKSDGTIVKWPQVNSPPPDLGGVIAVSTSGSHHLALQSDGNVVASGFNSYGETNVPPGLRARAVAAGARFSGSRQAHSVAVIDSTVDFGNQIAGTTSAAKTFTIRNGGTAPLSISSVTVTGHDASRFAVNTAGMLNTVPPNGQTTFAVSFNPVAAGGHHAKLQVLTNDPNRNQFYTHLSGTSVPQLQLVTAASRKAHGAAGNFDVNLPLTGAAGIEPRNSAGAGPTTHTFVFTFTNDIVSGSAAVTSGQAAAGNPSFSGKTMSLQLTGVTNAQQIGVTLSGITDGSGQVLPNIEVKMRVLAGDVNGSGGVNATDIGQTKASSGQPVSAANFRQDVNVSGGSIGASDIGQVKALSGTQLP